MCLLLPSAQLISPSPTTFGRQQPLSAALTLRTQPNLYGSRLCSLFPEPLISALASATASLRWIRVYEAVRRYVNFFQPSFKLIDKTRDGATTVKHYSQPTTPCDRLIQHDTTSDGMKDALNEYRARLDPVLLLHTIRAAQSALVAATAPELRETPSGESLDRFLTKLPSLWRQGKVRPTHAARVSSPRHWRTRNDPFEGVRGDVLVWLQAEPDATGKALMARLQSEHPDRFTEPQLRTMQRRVKEWRGILAKKLVYAGTGESSTEPSGLPEMALIGADSKCQSFGNIL